MNYSMSFIGIEFTWPQVALGVVLAVLPLPCAYYLYSKYVHIPRIVCKRPPYGKMRIAYKFRIGPYNKCEKYFCELYNLVPCLNLIGIFYEDPMKVPPEKYRYVTGAIMSEGDDSADSAIVQKLKDNGYSFIDLPEVSAAVHTRIQVKTNLTYSLAPCRVYCKMDTYIRDKKLEWNPAIEIYDGESIQYMVPQDKGEQFCVPEVPYKSLKLD